MSTKIKVETWSHPATNKTMHVPQDKKPFSKSVSVDGKPDIHFEGWEIAESVANTSCGSHREFLKIYQTESGTLILHRVKARLPCHVSSTHTNEAAVIEDIKEVNDYFGMTRAAKSLYKHTDFIEEPKNIIE